jgi:CubicO group peptidase (beta-lactamase class C family)
MRNTSFATARRALILSAVAISPLVAQKSKNPLDGFDGYIAQAMKDWKVPGLAIAIVKNDSIVLMKGYGTRTMNQVQPVDEHTLFAIGSSSKAFTATLVAMMVDEGKMRWDDPAAQHLPGFQVFDPYVSRELTMRDLLTHRSGLARGDLVWYATDFSRDEILRRVRFLKPSWSFRSRYGYQNIMYLAAGQAVSRAAGASWDDLIQQRIFAPLGMNESNTSVRSLAGRSNVATPHSEIDDTLRVVAWHNIDNIAPAGSINSSASDMIKWVRLQLAEGKVAGKSVVSASALAETHTAQLAIPRSADSRQINPFTHLASYGMGWTLQDYRGRQLDQHGGNIDGMSAMVGLMPEEKLGLVILTNANGSPLPTIAMFRAIDALIGAPPRDWSAEYRKVNDKARAQAKEAEQKRDAQRVAGTKPSLPFPQYAGVYADSMYGEAAVKAEGSGLRLAYGAGFEGALEHWHHDTFRAVWSNRALGKAFVTFALGADGKVKSVDVDGFGTFGRKPEAVDTTHRIVLASNDAVRLTGTYKSEVPAMTVDVQYTDGALKLSVPGQPVYTLVADSPTRFRLTGPPSMPAGFFVEFELEAGKVKTLKLIQPAPRPTLTMLPRR